MLWVLRKGRDATALENRSKYHCNWMRWLVRYKRRGVAEAIHKEHSRMRGRRMHKCMTCCREVNECSALCCRKCELYETICTSR